jgi:predicted dehydrogenase
MGEPDRVMATRSIQLNTKMEGEDSVLLMAESRYGWRASMLFNWAGPRGDLPDIVVAGTEATMELRVGKPAVDIYPAGGSAIAGLVGRAGLARIAAWLADPRRKRYRLPVPGDDPAGYRAEIAEFLAAVAEDRLPASPGIEGRRDLEIVLAGYRSLETGAWADIPATIGARGRSRRSCAPSRR